MHIARCTALRTAVQHWSIKTCDWFSIRFFLFGAHFSFIFFSFRFFSFGFGAALFIFERVPVAVSNIGPDVHFEFVYEESPYVCTTSVALCAQYGNERDGIKAMCSCEIRKWQFNRSRHRIWRQIQTHMKTCFGALHSSCFASCWKKPYRFFALINDWCQRKVFPKDQHNTILIRLNKVWIVCVYHRCADPG